MNVPNRGDRHYCEDCDKDSKAPLRMYREHSNSEGVMVCKECYEDRMRNRRLMKGSG